jgi:transcriptional regulator with XRE-family HTH domain
VDKGLSFGYCVRRRRKVSDLTQTELAGQVYCALSTIKKIELDERHPSRQMAERLAECPHEVTHQSLSSILFSYIRECLIDTHKHTYFRI